MSRIIEILEHPHTKMAIASLAAVAVVGGVVYYMKKNELLFFKAKPKNWIKVGVISPDMWIFPIKSCGPIVVSEFECSNLGPKSDYLRDRVFMVVRQSNNEFVTARTYPKMVLITPRFEKNVMRISAPGMSEIAVDVERLLEAKERATTATVWRNDAAVIDCGDEAAAFFSKFLLDQDEGFRLVFYPSDEPKPKVADKKKLFKQADRADSGSLHDETSYMLMNVASFDDLNTRLEKPVGPLQFRPNFVVNGAKAWDEDNWKFVKIGDDAMFRKVEPCLRCFMTIIDPETGERNRDEQPLKTLKKFRLNPNFSKTSPVFGIQMGLRQPGVVRSGDAVYVSY